MCVYIILYFVIGVVVALVNNHLYTKLQTLEDEMNENPGMIIAIVMCILFWPLALVGTINMSREIIKYKRNGNS